MPTPTPNPYFDECFERLIGIEGGYVNDPQDPGGETKFGISKRSYPKLDIANLTLERAKGIYYIDFWQRMRADDLPSHIAFQVFDGAVNSGIETSLRWLQRAVGVAEDGQIGSVTLSAVNAANWDVVIRRYLGIRLEFMTKLSNWPSAGKGWARRIANQLKEAT